jgi:hypothetical protein
LRTTATTTDFMRKGLVHVDNNVDDGTKIGESARISYQFSRNLWGEAAALIHNLLIVIQIAALFLFCFFNSHIWKTLPSTGKK